MISASRYSDKPRRPVLHDPGTRPKAVPAGRASAAILPSYFRFWPEGLYCAQSFQLIHKDCG